MKKVMSTCPGLNLVQSNFSCLAALTNPDVELSWAKSSLSVLLGLEQKIIYNRKLLCHLGFH